MTKIRSEHGNVQGQRRRRDQKVFVVDRNPSPAKRREYLTGALSDLRVDWNDADKTNQRPALFTLLPGPHARKQLKDAHRRYESPCRFENNPDLCSEWLAPEKGDQYRRIEDRIDGRHRSAAGSPGRTNGLRLGVCSV